MQDKNMGLEGGIFSPGEAKPTKKKGNTTGPLEQNNTNKTAQTEKPGELVPFFSARPTSELAMLTADKPQRVQYSARAEISHGDIIAIINNFGNIKIKNLRVSTVKLLDIFILRLTKQVGFRTKEKNINANIEISLDEFMDLMGIPKTKVNKDKARRRVVEDLKMLFSISLGWTDETGQNFSDVRICEAKGIRKGIISFTFTNTLAKYLANKFVADFPTQILQTDERNGNAYPLAKKLATHSSIENNILKGTADRIKVYTALLACVQLPIYERVKKTNRHFADRIIKPFLKTLDGLEESGLEFWRLENRNGEIIPRAEAEKMPYENFKELYLRFKFKGQNTEAKKRKILAKKAQEKEGKNTLKKDVNQNK